MNICNYLLILQINTILNAIKYICLTIPQEREKQNSANVYKQNVYITSNYIRTYIHTYIYTYIHTYLHTCIPAYIYALLCACGVHTAGIMLSIPILSFTCVYA